MDAVRCAEVARKASTTAATSTNPSPSTSQRRRRAERIAAALERAGIPDAYVGARALADGGLISRTHFARYLVKLGLAGDERQVFKHYLVKGKPGHVAGQWADLTEAMDWIHQAGGQAVIAHPARYRMTRAKLLRLLQQFGAFREVQVVQCLTQVHQLVLLYHPSGKGFGQGFFDKTKQGGAEFLKGF